MSFIEFVRNTRAEFEDFLRQKMPTQEDGEPIWKLLQGGKRLRPLLCILSYRACGGTDQNYGEALDVATAVELGHCASLCHDDIIDKDLKRRGNPALWVEEGVPEAMLEGHRAISLGLQISLSHGGEIAETFLGAWNRAVSGALAEVDMRRAKKISAAEYLRIIEEKTASLFSAAAKIGSQLARAPKELQRLMEDYGAAVGAAYQLADDLSELHGGKAGELSSLMHQAGKSSGVVPLREFLEEKMEAAIKKAEKLSRDEGIPEGKFRPLLSQAPRYFAGKILGGMR